MQFFLRQTLGQTRTWAPALLGLSLAATVYAAQPEKVVKLNEPISKRSEFTDDLKFGKDPFFPNSMRRQQNNEPAPETIKVAAFTKLKLQGISGAKDNPLAILNNRTFGPGEEAEIKIDGQSIRLRCVEIRARSVMVAVNGQPPQELFLGQRF